MRFIDDGNTLKYSEKADGFDSYYRIFTPFRLKQMLSNPSSKYIPTKFSICRFDGLLGWEIQDGPLSVINGVMPPINGLIIR